MANSSNHLTRHHIIPQSRTNGRNLGESNVAVIPRLQHEAYHTMFDNKTPDEIIIHLVNTYWNKDTNWVWAALSKLQD